MIVDTHAHLDLPEFAGDLPEVIRRAGEAGVERILTVGIDLDSSRAAVELAENHPGVWAAVGVHPNEASSWDGSSAARLRELLAHPRVVAVGETGLDFYRERTPADLQAAVFRQHLSLARDHDLPLIIHARNSLGEVGEILEREGRGLRGVMHCFSGYLEEGRRFLDLGFKLGLGGPLTYPNAGHTRDMATALPAESFVLETDCPYLPHQGRRGERNEPAWTVAVAEALARLKGLEPEDIARITSAGARELFRLGLQEPAGEIAYRIRRSLYLNITNRCPNRCTFCGRRDHFRVKGHDLRLLREPSPAELLSAVDRERDFDEVVFCGYGEPLLLPETVRVVASALKQRGLRVRVNTNGLASLVHGRSLPREFHGLVDAYSISLNAADAEAYEGLCRPSVGPDPFRAVLDFAREARAAGAEVTLTAVDLPGVDLPACRRLAEDLGAAFRVRTFNEVG